MQTATLDCGHAPSEHASFTTGFGTDSTGRTLCYDCCADADKEALRRREPITLYLVKSEASPGLWVYEITNWPGSLRIRIGGAVSHGRHNFAGTRTDAWFSFEGNNYHAVQYGNNSQIAHCRPVK